MNLTKEELYKLLEKAFREGQIGYDDLKETALNKLIDEFLAEKPIPAKPQTHCGEYWIPQPVVQVEQPMEPFTIPQPVVSDFPVSDITVHWNPPPQLDFVWSTGAASSGHSFVYSSTAI